MTIRRKLFVYLVLLHAVFAAVLFTVLRENRIWIVGVEVLFLVSLLLATKLFRSLFRPLELLSASVEFLREKDFSTRLVETGPPEMDRLIGVYNQMVDSLRAERLAGQEQHHFLERILQVSPSAIVILDHDGRISYVNPSAASLFRRNADSLTGAGTGQLGEPFAGTVAGMENGDSAIVALHGARKVLCRKSMFIDRGHPRTFFVFEELTEELRKTEKAAYEKLIRMLSHEVNNSLGAANSLLHSCLHYSSQLAEGDRKDFESAIGVAISRTDHLNAFMKSFADILRLPAPLLVPTDVRVPLEGIARLLHAELTRRSITLRLDLAPDTGPVPMDPRQMEQVFLNVMKNAMEAIGTGGLITVRLGSNDGRKWLRFEDSGSGITEETRRQLFTPFFSTKENGQGIGLALVQEILTRHRFDFTLESIPGEPTRFTIYFDTPP